VLQPIDHASTDTAAVDANAIDAVFVVQMRNKACHVHRVCAVQYDGRDRSGISTAAERNHSSI
jgi:hypothetical protein